MQLTAGQGGTVGRIEVDGRAVRGGRRTRPAGRRSLFLHGVRLERTNLGLAAAQGHAGPPHRPGRPARPRPTTRPGRTSSRVTAPMRSRSSQARRGPKRSPSSVTRSRAWSRGGSLRTIPSSSPRCCSKDPPLLAAETPEAMRGASGRLPHGGDFLDHRARGLSGRVSRNASPRSSGHPGRRRFERC